MIEPSRYAEGPAMLLAGLRRQHAFATASQTISAQWEDFRQFGSIPGQRGAITYGVVCASAPERQWFEYMSGIEVDSFDALPPRMGRMRVPAQHYAVFVHEGHADALRATWEAIWSDWLPRSGRQPADTPDFERYGERFDPETRTGEIEIWFPLQPAEQG